MKLKRKIIRMRMSKAKKFKLSSCSEFQDSIEQNRVLGIAKPIVGVAELLVAAGRGGWEPMVWVRWERSGQW